MAPHSSGEVPDRTLSNGSEDEFRKIIDTVPVLVTRATPDGALDFINNRWLEFLGVSMETVNGWGWTKVTHPEDLENFLNAWRSAMDSGKPLEAEARVRRADGHYRWLLIRAVPVKDQSGKIINWYATSVDIEDRKRAEKMLKQSQTYLAEAQRLSRTGSFGWNVNTGELYWSDETFCILGFDKSFKPNLNAVFERIHKDDLSFVKQKLDEASKEKKRFDFEHRLVMPDGTIKHVHVIAQSENRDGEQIEFVGAIMDVTEQKRVSEELRASEHLARGQLAALARTLDSLAQEFDPDKLPKHVVTTILTQMGAHSVTIWERNGDVLDLLGIVEGGHFKTSIEAGFGGSIPIFENVPPLWREALEAGMHFVIENISEEPTKVVLADGRSAIWPTSEMPAVFADLKKYSIASGVRKLLASPMMMAGKFAGIIGIRFTGSRAFGPEEIELTKALAHQAMLAMRLMRLSEQSREAAIVAERNRFARDIHDTLAQGFTGVIMQLEAAKGAASQGNVTEANNRIERASELARSSLSEARRSVRALRPLSLRDRTLFIALDNLLKQMTEGLGMNAEFRGEGDERNIPAEFEEALLRITQEALTNAIKHANAKNFNATLTVGGDRIQLQLTDDGRGFDPQAEYEGFGLIGMKERIDRMDGEFMIRSKPNFGTEILIRLKVQALPKADDGNE